MLLIRNKFNITDKENYVEFFVKIMCVLYKLNLSRGGRMLVVYYMLYGIDKEVHKKFLKDKRVGNMNSLYNLREELKKFNVLIKNKIDEEYELCEYFNSDIEGKVGFQLLITNEL